MKKSLLALAALTAFAGAASAQSSVTLFGIVDLSVNSIKNGSNTMKTMTTDNLASSRLGFRGVEDLGGGMSAGFWIEGALSPDTGGSSQTWSRRSTVSLMGGFGEIRLGRDYTPTWSNKGTFDPFGTNGLGSESNIEAVAAQPVGASKTVANTPLQSGASNGDSTLTRANNTVSYILPTLGGVYGVVQVAAGEGAVANKYMGGRIGYAAGPVNVAGAWGKTYKGGTMVDDFTDFNFGASYNLGFMTLMGQYGKRDYNTSDQKTMLVGVTVPFGASTLKASFAKASGAVRTNAGVLVQDQGAKQLAVGYQYDLSKRTALYATYASLNNDGNATTGAGFTINPGGTMTKGATSSGYNFGLRHIF